MTPPPHSENVHHEVELLVALKSGGTNIAVGDALSHVWGYAPCLDMTRRDLQDVAHGVLARTAALIMRRQEHLADLGALGVAGLGGRGEPAAGALDELPRGGGGDVQHARDLLVAHAVQLAHQQRGALRCEGAQHEVTCPAMPEYLTTI